jgi:hypothetical protein
MLSRIDLPGPEIKFFIQYHEYKKKCKQSIKSAPQKQIGSQEKFQAVHRSDDHSLRKCVKPWFNTAENPNRHCDLSETNRPGQYSGVGTACDPGNDLLVARHQVQDFTEKAVCEPNGRYQVIQKLVYLHAKATPFHQI